MITSRRPWTIKQADSGLGAMILDQSGSPIGFILDYANAELIIKEVNTCDREICRNDNSTAKHFSSSYSITC